MTNQKKQFADNLQAQMSKKGIDRYQLCRDLGFKYSTVSEWLSANKYPRIDKIEMLAQYFGIKKSDLIEGTSSNAEIISTGENIYKIPLFNSVSAGFGAYACSDIVDYIPLYINNPVDVPEMLCIKVEGNSMYPKIEDGDIIVVRKQDSVDSGSIAVVLVDGEEGFVKRVVYDNETIELQSINPEYEPKIFKGRDVLRVRVVGLVRQIIKTL